jgi:hypothetical protein
MSASWASTIRRSAPSGQGPDVAAALDGFTVVVLDSVREMVGQLEGSNNDDDSITALYNLVVTPLLIKSVAVLLLDNTGHENTHRPKGAGGKMDAAPQVFKVVTDAKFGPDKTGKVVLTCTRSRFGDEGRKWTVRLGDGVYELPASTSEAPDAQAVQRVMRRREAAKRLGHSPVVQMGIYAHPIEAIGPRRYRDLDDLITEARGALVFPQSSPSTGDSR